MDRDLDVTEDLLEWVAEGRTITTWCEQVGLSTHFVLEWVEKDADFAAQLKQAQRRGYRMLAERTLDYVNEEPPTNLFGQVDSGYVAWRKLQVGHTMHLLKVFDRATYGDQQSVRIGGDADAPPVQFSDVERAAKLNSILAAAKKRLGLTEEEEEG